MAAGRLATRVQARVPAPATAAGRDALASAGVAAGELTVDRFARWLLLAVAADLVLTRFLVRLAIFIPKGEPWQTGSAILGRIGAAADALVPLAGLLLLAALLLRAGRRGGRAERACLVAVALVAGGGFALVVLPPAAPIAVLLDLAIVAIALLTGIRAARRPSVPALARAGLASLALAVGLAAVARLVDGPAAGPALAPADGLAIGQAGQVAFLGGAAAVGIAGLVAGRRGRGDLVPAGLGVLLAAGILGFAARAPLMWGALAIWSSGLTGGVPAVLVAPALGLAVAGLPLLLRSRPRASVGTAIVLAAGYDLAASGLLLAGLLGLVVASDTEAQE